MNIFSIIVKIDFSFELSCKKIYLHEGRRGDPSLLKLPLKLVLLHSWLYWRIQNLGLLIIDLIKYWGLFRPENCRKDLHVPPPPAPGEESCLTLCF